MSSATPKSRGSCPPRAGRRSGSRSQARANGRSRSQRHGRAPQQFARLAQQLRGLALDGASMRTSEPGWKSASYRRGAAVDDFPAWRQQQSRACGGRRVRRFLPVLRARGPAARSGPGRAQARSGARSVSSSSGWSRASASASRASGCLRARRGCGAQGAHSPLRRGLDPCGRRALEQQRRLDQPDEVAGGDPTSPLASWRA